ncbi:SapB/AmfS family lanthipeptide [Saccharopolyspora gloriosae]|uniref:SapB/AmfS family lanthipeptide n=1 Tax=Saccharopolyspora gloriosae TaxID=455344 RepID=UPI002867B1D8|nr:SapB/AmfS family lanthipeptide [Saccharopolyspora gloriosae]
MKGTTMEMVLQLQELEAHNDASFGGGGADNGSNLSLLVACANSTVSLLTCN